MTKDKSVLPTIEQWIQEYWHGWCRHCDESGEASGSFEEFKEPAMEALRVLERDGFILSILCPDGEIRVLRTTKRDDGRENTDDPVWLNYSP